MPRDSARLGYCPWPVAPLSASAAAASAQPAVTQSQSQCKDGGGRVYYVSPKPDKRTGPRPAYYACFGGTYNGRLISDPPSEAGAPPGAR